MDSYPPVASEKIQAPFLILGLLFAVTVGASVIPASWFGIRSTARQYAPLNLGSLAQPENLANDADNNGSISWKELVASSLNLNPGDIPTNLEVDPRASAILNDENNLTASLSKNLYIAANALTQTGITDEENKQKVINQLISQETDKIVATTYTPADLSTIPDSKTAIKEYGNKVALILEGLITEESIVQDLASIHGYIETADASKLIPLKENTVRATSVIKKLLALKVPTSAVSVHITALNSLSEYANVLSNLSVADTDALRTSTSINKYPDSTVAALRTYPLLGNYFTTKNITFSSTEPGYIYVVGYTGVTH